jgi:phosphatidylserine/phosphatidylglycerophosphate/cardiolipin synthase-like enzyme
MSTKPMVRRSSASGESADRFVFAPEDRLPTLLDLIGSARERLILSLFRCDDFRLLDALATALQRNVKVEVLLTGRAKGWRKRLHELWGVLESMGAKLHRYGDPVVKYHAKYVVADDGPALVASLNFTQRCFAATCDFMLLTSDRNVVTSLKRLFKADCLAPDASLPTRLSNRLIIGPEHARHQLTKLLDHAKRSIRIVDPKVTDPAILALLKAKREAGVLVKVVGREPSGGYSPHGKMMLIDEAIGVVGSVALSALNLDFRREVALIVRRRDCVSQMNEVFQHLLSRSEPRDTLAG